MANNATAENDCQRSETNEYKDYCFCSNFDGDGEIYSRDNKIVWRFQTTGLKQRSTKSKSFNKFPIFIFCDSDGKELLAIYREKRLPFARFKIVEKDLPVCTISQRSIFFTKYDFEFSNGLKWNLYLPMFSVFGKGASENGNEILVRVRARRQWFVRIATGFDNPPMMAALAYIIRKKEQCT
jgi:uncharacterized protein YxjI